MQSFTKQELKWIMIDVQHAEAQMREIAESKDAGSMSRGIMNLGADNRQEIIRKLKLIIHDDDKRISIT
jgi:hypothetical protein